MDNFKKLVRKSMHLLTEADEYGNDYIKTDDRTMKDLYYTLSNGHLDMYNKVYSTISSYVSKMESSHPDIRTIWDFLRDYEAELMAKIKEKLK